MKKDIRKFIKESLADIFMAAQEQEAPVETPTQTPTKPEAPGNPLKIPTKWPDNLPKPRPKAAGEEVAPVETPTQTPTKPEAPGNPLKIPTKWPDNLPKPRPKANNKNPFSLNEDYFRKCEKSILMAKELRKMKAVLKESVIREMGMRIDDPNFAGEPHPSVRQGVEAGKPTAFSDSELFTGGDEDYSTLEKIGSEEFNKIINDLKEQGKLSVQEIMQAFQLMMQVEQPHARQLEQLALNKVKQQFGLPDSIMEKLKAKLTPQPPEKPDDEDEEDDMEEEVMEDMEFTDEEKVIIRKHVDKRKIQNALMMGAGYRAHSIFNDVQSDLDSIDPRLYPLYMQVMPNVSLFMWSVAWEDNMDQAQMMGRSEIKEEEVEKENEEGEMETQKEITAEAQAMVFPILLHEVAKAALELLFAQYLIDLGEQHGERVYKEVLKQSDVFNEEIWMKRIGPTLWKYLHDLIDYIVVQERQGNYTIVSYLLNKISLMEPEAFIELMKKVVYSGPEAISELNIMIEEIEGQIEAYEQHQSGQSQGEEIEPQDLETGDAIERPDVEAELTQVARDAMTKSADNIEERPDKPISDMNIDELNIVLQNSLEKEDYEMAAQVRDEINKRTE